MTDIQIGDVSDTALWVAAYRALESERPDALFHDAMASVLVGDRGRDIVKRMKRSHLTAWSVVIRTVMIDNFIHDLVAKGVDTIINIGAGLDTRPYRMALPPSLTWIEADFPHMIAMKEEKLRDARPVCQLRRAAVDLADRDAVKAFLADAVAGAGKALVLTEGVVMYLTAEQVSSLATDIKAQPAIGYWILDYYTKSMHRHFTMRSRREAMKNAPFRFFPGDWRGFFKKHGFAIVDIRYYGLEGLRLKRRPPARRWVNLMFKLMPKTMRIARAKSSGYAVLEPMR